MSGAQFVAEVLAAAYEGHRAVERVLGRWGGARLSLPDHRAAERAARRATASRLLNAKLERGDAVRMLADCHAISIRHARRIISDVLRQRMSASDATVAASTAAKDSQ